MDISLSIITGVVSGIITSALLFISSKAIITILIPWYQAIIYRGIDVSGDWVLQKGKNTDNKFSQGMGLILKQNASKISGTSVLILEDDSGLLIEKTRRFKISGSIEDRFIQLNLLHENRNRIGMQSLLLEAVSDGRILRGGSVFYNTISCSITSSQIEFIRQDVIIEKDEGLITIDTKGVGTGKSSKR